MTTKHVVADDVFGNINRKQWEVNRRILEGTLDPHDVLKRLQSIIENAPSSFEIENQRHFTLSEKSYEVKLAPKRFKSVYEYANQTYLFNRIDEEITSLTAPRQCKLTQTRVRLGRVTKELGLSVLRYELELAGIKPASAWELIAFVEQSPVTRVWRTRDEFLSVVQGPSIKHTYEDGSGGKTYEAYTSIYMMDNQGRPSGWWFRKHRLSESSPEVIYPSTYFLVLDE